MFVPRKREPVLPADHAFVVQFRAQPGGSPLHYEGRVEHVISGRARHFDSREVLLAFIERILGQIPPPPR